MKQNRRAFTIIEMAMVFMLLGIALLLANKLLFPNPQKYKDERISDDISRVTESYISDMRYGDKRVLTATVAGNGGAPILDSATYWDDRGLGVVKYLDSESLPFIYYSGYAGDNNSVCAIGVDPTTQRPTDPANLTVIQCLDDECSTKTIEDYINGDCGVNSAQDNVSFIMIHPDGINDYIFEVADHDGDGVADQNMIKLNNVGSDATVTVAGEGAVQNGVTHGYAKFYTEDTLRALLDCPALEIIPNDVPPLRQSSTTPAANYTTDFFTSTGDSVYWCIDVAPVLHTGLNGTESQNALFAVTGVGGAFPAPEGFVKPGELGSGTNSCINNGRLWTISSDRARLRLALLPKSGSHRVVVYTSLNNNGATVYTQRAYVLDVSGF